MKTKNSPSRRIKTIVFDFDGVIIDSVWIKRQAYLDLFRDKETKNVVSKILNELEGNTRFDIFRRIFTDFNYKGKKLEKKIKKYSDKYDNLVSKEILSKGLAEEVFDSLLELSRNYNLYINSNTPKESLRKSVEALRIKDFFKGIHGAGFLKKGYIKNRSKKINLRRIIKTEKVEASEIVFVGDGKEDFSAAREIGCLFIAIQTKSNRWENCTFPVAKNINDLKYLIKKLHFKKG